MKRAHKTAILAGAVAATLALASVSTAFAKSVLRLRYNGDITQLDPLFSTAYPNRDMAYLIWDTLYSMDSKLTPQPQMVERHTLSPDGLTYTFTLRDKLAFHDGAPVTSADVIASIKRWMTKDSLGLNIQSRMQTLEAVDDKTFRLILKQPFGQVLNGFARMTSYPLFVMPKRIAETPIGELKEWIGSGPFKLVKSEWVPGVKFVVEKNEAYVPRKEPADNLAGGKIPGVDRIERILIPDENSAVNALLAGEIDYMTTAPTDFLQIFEKTGTFEIAKQPLPGSSMQIVPNHTLPPFDNIKVRQALQYAINQTDLMTSLYGNRKDLWKPCPAMFMCGQPYDTDVNSQRYMKQDLEKARALLKEAGYNGTPVMYMHPMDSVVLREGGTVLVEAMRRAGFVVDDVQMDTATFFSRRNNKGPVSAGGWNLFLTAFNGDAMQDPLINPFVTGACDKAFVGWPCDDKLQAAWQEFMNASDKASSKAAAVKIQDRANEIVTFIPGGQFDYVSVWNKKVKNVVTGNIVVFWNVTMDK